jgi:hypothetical protein
LISLGVHVVLLASGIVGSSGGLQIMGGDVHDRSFLYSQELLASDRSKVLATADEKYW